MKYKMLKRTTNDEAPWTVVRSDDKHLARLNVMKVILDAVDYEGRDGTLDFVPDPGIVVSGAREVEIMKAQRIKSGRFIG
jgi:hypothetical protein